MKPFAGVGKPIRPSVDVAGMTPAQIKAAYKLTNLGGGSGTIAIIDAYDDPTIFADLNTFDKHFGLPSCTESNNCLEKHKMTTSVKTSVDWSGEIALDVEWAHAIAPSAQILLVEASTGSRTNLLKAVDYARKRQGVVAISMSWGGTEFSAETRYNSHFSSDFGASFFASSGDDGHGVSWPATSDRVIGVGGSTLKLSASGKVTSETAWSGSGGGLSSYFSEPDYQTTHGVKSGGARAVPDVAYNANPNTGFPIYDSTGGSGWWN